MALRARLGEAALIGAESTQVAAVTTSSRVLLGKASLISLAGLAVLGGLWFFAARNHRAAPSVSNLDRNPVAVQEAAVAHVPSETVSSTPSSPERSSNDNAAAAIPAPNRNAAPVVSHHARDTLAEEVALLARAETALHRGKPALALEILNEHERRFGVGLLAEERIAARAQALCALGRTAAADAQLSQLSPKSLHGEPSRQACGSGPGN